MTIIRTLIRKVLLARQDFIKIKILSLILLITISLSPCRVNAAAGVAGALSVIPGLGQVYNGDILEGIGWFTTIVGMVILGPNLPLNGPVAGSQIPFFSQAGFDLWFYNMYDAYRDAHPELKRYSNETVFQNYLGALNPINIIDPIGGPTLVIYTEGLGTMNGTAGHLIQPIRPFFFGFVGLGEEGLFRGFLFPALSDVLKSKFFGAFTSSIIFSASHITNGIADARAGAIPRFLLGMVFCWQINHNNYDLRKNIFAHSWIDVVVEPDASDQTPLASSDATRVGLKWSIPL